MLSGYLIRTAGAELARRVPPGALDEVGGCTSPWRPSATRFSASLISMARAGGNKQPPILLGGAATVPVPMGDADLETDTDPLSPGGRKRGGAGGAAAAPAKKEKTATETVTLDVSKLRALLAEQSQELLTAQQGPVG